MPRGGLARQAKHSSGGCLGHVARPRRDARQRRSPNPVCGFPVYHQRLEGEASALCTSCVDAHCMGQINSMQAIHILADLIERRASCCKAHCKRCRLGKTGAAKLNQLHIRGWLGCGPSCCCKFISPHCRHNWPCRPLRYEARRSSDVPIARCAILDFATLTQLASTWVQDGVCAATGFRRSRHEREPRD